jgi:hypothetical protein
VTIDEKALAAMNLSLPSPPGKARPAAGTRPKLAVGNEWNYKGDLNLY